MEQPLYSNARIDRDKNEVIAQGMLLGVNSVAEWEEGGHKFRIDKIVPKQVGAQVREYELFDNDIPAYGGRWHASLESAYERATFVATSSMHDQIDYLWGLVHKYRRMLDVEHGDM